MADTPTPKEVSELLMNQLNISDAYQRAVNKLKLDRANRQGRSGLLGDWTVDPKSMYGTYQALLQLQGQELDNASFDSQDRGLFGPGLGNQAERILRYQQAVENLQYKQQLADWEAEYRSGLADAEATRQQGLIDNATGGGHNGTGDGGGGGGDGSGIVSPKPGQPVGPQLPGFQRPWIGNPAPPVYIDPATGRPVRESGGPQIKVPYVAPKYNRPGFQGGK